MGVLIRIPTRRAERIRRGVNQHTFAQLMEDVTRMGFLNHAEAISQFMGQYVGGTAANDTFNRYFATFNRADASTLSNERV